MKEQTDGEKWDLHCILCKKEKSGKAFLKSNGSALLWGTQLEFYRLEKKCRSGLRKDENGAIGFRKRDSWCQGGGRCKIEGRWVMWINLAAARSIQRQFHGTWKWIRRVGFTLTLLCVLSFVWCVVICAMHFKTGITIDSAERALTIICVIFG